MIYKPRLAQFSVLSVSILMFDKLKKHSIVSYLPMMTALKMLKMQSNLKTISDARPADATSEKDNKEDDEDEDDPQLFGQAKSAMQDVLHINTKKSDLTLHERMTMLNADQRRIYDWKILSHRSCKMPHTQHLAFK